MINEKLHVIAVISNSRRYKKRYELFHSFSKIMEQNPAVEFHVVELAYGGRPFEVTDQFEPNHTQLRTADELWHKENLINIGIQRLPHDWKYVAWIDADVVFARPDWAEETIHQLQHHAVVQMFSECVDLSPRFDIVSKEQGGEHRPGFVFKNTGAGKASNYIEFGHPGYAWAATREAIETLGGLLDVSICGANDHHMARALFGDMANSHHHDISSDLKAHLKRWEKRALKLRKNVGYVNGLILHNWHGSKKNRQYLTRWKILVDNNYAPTTDIEKDAMGVYRLVDDTTERHVKLRDQLRQYFSQRNEDEI